MYSNMLLGDSNLVGRGPHFEKFCFHLCGPVVREVFLWPRCHWDPPQLKATQGPHCLEQNLLDQAFRVSHVWAPTRFLASFPTSPTNSVV